MRRELRSYMRSSWAGLKEALLRLITDGSASADEMLSIRKKQELINEILFDNDDIVKFGDFDEFKIARAFYKVGDICHTVEYLERCLEKWTGVYVMKNISPWRDISCVDLELSKQEIKHNAEKFIKKVKLYFADIYENDAISALLEKAERIYAE